jgi:NAD(P)-dependent dehydrogenase (short-subunit alcohol dehydrogenase family)
MNIPERTISEDGLELHFATNHIGHFLFTSLIMPKLLRAAEGNPRGSTRIVNVTSMSPTFAGIRWSDINFEKVNTELPEDEQPSYDVHKRWGSRDPETKSYLPLEGYNQSKVANVLFSIGLNRRLYDKYGILSLAVHPGIIRTELSRYAAPETVAAIQEMLKSGAFPIKTMGAGAATSLVAATDPGVAIPETRNGRENYGVFLIDCQPSDKILPKASSNEGAEKLWKLSEQLVNENFAW